MKKRWNLYSLLKSEFALFLWDENHEKNVYRKIEIKK